MSYRLLTGEEVNCSVTSSPGSCSKQKSKAARNWKLSFFSSKPIIRKYNISKTKSLIYFRKELMFAAYFFMVHLNYTFNKIHLQIKAERSHQQQVSVLHIFFLPDDGWLMLFRFPQSISFSIVFPLLAHINRRTGRQNKNKILVSNHVFRRSSA